MQQRNGYFDPRPAEAMRVAPRRIVFFEAQLASSALGHVRADVVDISRLGCRIDVNCRLLVDGFVAIRLPGLEPLGSRVAWSRSTDAGLSFARPLAAAVLDRLVAAHGAR